MTSPAIVLIPRINQVSGIVVTAAMRVHSLLGPGLLESAYQACLAQELRKRGFMVETQVGLTVVYEGEKLDLGFTPKDKEEGAIPIPDSLVELLQARRRRS